MCDRKRPRYHTCPIALFNGSALVETFITPRGTGDLFVYHRDGTALMLTHDCAQGNQARLKATRVFARRCRVRSSDVTNVGVGREL